MSGLFVLIRLPAPLSYSIAGNLPQLQSKISLALTPKSLLSREFKSLQPAKQQGSRSSTVLFSKSDFSKSDLMWMLREIL